MLIARMRELHHSTAAQHALAARLAERADALIVPAFRRQLRVQPRDLRCRHREAQLVVVTTAQREQPRALLAERRAQRLGDRQFLEGKLGAERARLRELAGIPEQPVGYVDAGAREGAQPLTERDARRRQQKALAQVVACPVRRREPALLERETRGGVTRVSR